MARIARTLDKKPLPRYRPSDGLRTACYLCGSTGNMTKEHVFARSTFRPNDLEHPLILSACARCNAEKERDEDYANTIFTMTTETDSIQDPRKRNFETFAKRKAKEKSGEKVLGLGIHNKIINQLEEVRLVTERGEDLGIGGRFVMDANRIKEFYLRIFKGLHTAATRAICNWDNYEIKFQFDNITHKQHINDDAYFYPINNAQFVEGWGEHLLFAGLRIEHDAKLVSMWSLALYGEHIATGSFNEL